jgi:Flp pilus assembly protein TadG
MHTPLHKTKHLRDGTTAVEAALVLPIFFVLLFGIFTFGYVRFVDNMLNRACRTAARLGAVEGITNTEVETHVLQALAPVASPDKITVLVKNAEIYDTGTPNTSAAGVAALPDLDLTTAEPGQLFVVGAQVTFSDITSDLLPIPYIEDTVITAQSFMRHE